VDDFASCVAKHVPGESLLLEYRSRGAAKKASVMVAQDPSLELVTFEKARLDVSEAVKSFRNSWLGSRAIHREVAESVVIW
jgi:hypothetical protein